MASSSPFKSTPAVGKTTAVPPSELHLFHRNPRKGDVTAIAASLRRHGQYKPITANIGTYTDRPREVLAGNHTLLAFRQLAEDDPADTRWHKILVHWVDVDDDMADRIVVADNRTSELGGFDDAELVGLLEGFGDDIEGLGFSAEDIDELSKLVNPPDPFTGDPDDVPDKAESGPTRTQVGQSWRLGPHILLVGDATDTEAVKAWLGAAVPDAVWTDPPYGVEYVGKTKDAKTITNDGAAGLVELIAAATRTMVEVARPGAPVYVAAPSGPQFADFAAGLREGGFSWRQTLAWVKNTMVLGRSDYHYQHESIFYGFTPAPEGSGRLGRGGDHWHGDNTATTLLSYDRPSRSEEHPTMKPTALIAECLGNSCPRDGLVLDLFGGSGSTLIAAHMLGMSAAVVELDPRYADVILARYEKATGEDAVLAE